MMWEEWMPVPGVTAVAAVMLATPGAAVATSPLLPSVTVEMPGAVLVRLPQLLLVAGRPVAPLLVAVAGKEVLLPSAP
jgi:hypothetical protein